jgi:hypothetical protein
MHRRVRFFWMQNAFQLGEAVLEGVYKGGWGPGTKLSG